MRRGCEQYARLGGDVLVIRVMEDKYTPRNGTIFHRL